MNFKNRQRRRIIWQYCIGWTLALIFLIIVRGVGTTENGQIEMEFWASIMYVIIIGPLFGSISGFAQILIEERMYKRISIRKLLTLRVVYAFLFVSTIIVFSYVFVARMYLDPNIRLVEFAFDEGSFPIYFYFLTVDFLMALLSQVNMLLGRNKLGNLIRGKYYTPREEERIFMFLDLRSSTQLAEKLGHIKYSMMIQDCFNDLGVVVEDEAEIYQYVGDEVVLTWELQDGLRNHNCLSAYFHFKEQLNKKKKYYLLNYDCSPFFKAGMNAGIVTVTEVGKYKKEIAYHGDTINTAARIQDQCNVYDQGLLISESLAHRLGDGGYNFKELGSIDLRGKEKKVPIYAVSVT